MLPGVIKIIIDIVLVSFMGTCYYKNKEKNSFGWCYTKQKTGNNEISVIRLGDKQDDGRLP